MTNRDLWLRFFEAALSNSYPVLLSTEEQVKRAVKVADDSLTEVVERRFPRSDVDELLRAVDALNAHPFKTLSVDERAAVLHVFSAASKLPRNE